MANPSPKALETIPGVGPRIAQDLWELGFQSPDELRDENPEELYARLCALKGQRIDRCMLYVFRCAVYYASNARHDPELLKWWKWKGDNSFKGAAVHKG